MDATCVVDSAKTEEEIGTGATCWAGAEWGSGDGASGTDGGLVSGTAGDDNDDGFFDDFLDSKTAETPGGSYTCGGLCLLGSWDCPNADFWRSLFCHEDEPKEWVCIISHLSIMCKLIKWFL